MTTSTTLTLCGFALAMLLSTTAGPAQAEPGIRIDLDHVDYTVSSEVVDLYARIELAARMVCVDSSSPWDAKRTEYIENCRAAVVADAVERIDQPKLTALHNQDDRSGRIELASD